MGDTCQARSERDHGGQVRRYLLEADSQPPGKGEAMIQVEVLLCETHRNIYFGSKWQTSNIRLTWVRKRGERKQAQERCPYRDRPEQWVAGLHADADGMVQCVKPKGHKPPHLMP